MNLFEKAAAGLNLTPGERATLKLLQSFLGAGVVSLLLAVPAVLSAKAGDPSITVASVGVMVGAFVHGVLMAWQKYVSAKGDTPLSGAIGAIDSAAAKAIADRYTHTESPVPSPTPTPTSAAPSA